MNRGQVAAKVAANKEKHPEKYCSAPRCLWAMSSGKCPKHPNAPIHMGRVVVVDNLQPGEENELNLPL
jgi:hypothetical protein